MTTPATSNPENAPKGATPESSKAIENHTKAAKHHDLASKHHLKAAKHEELGQQPEATHNSQLAHGHALIASETHREETKRQALKSSSK